MGGNNATRTGKVSYYYDEEFSVFQVSQNHPMKPLRIKMTDTLIKCYGLDKKMEALEIDEDYISKVDLSLFHSDDYVDCLKTLTIAKKEQFLD